MASTTITAINYYYPTNHSIQQTLSSYSSHCNLEINCLCASRNPQFPISWAANGDTRLRKNLCHVMFLHYL